MNKGYQNLQAFLTTKVKIVGMVSLSVLAILLLQAGIVSAARSPQITNPIYYACVNNTTGAPTIVSQKTKCQTGYRKIQWNQQGPIGPQGPQGPQGPAGVSQGYYGNQGQTNFAANSQLAPVVSTNPVAAGSYIVTASEMAVVDTNNYILCWIGSTDKGVDGNTRGEFGPPSQQIDSTINVTDTINVVAGDQIELYCASSSNDPNSYSYSAGITAIQITSVQSNVSQHTGKSFSLPKSLSPHK